MGVSKLDDFEMGRTTLVAPVNHGQKKIAITAEPACGSVLLASNAQTGWPAVSALENR